MWNTTRIAYCMSWDAPSIPAPFQAQTKSKENSQKTKKKEKKNAQAVVIWFSYKELPSKQKDFIIYLQMNNDEKSR